MIGLAWAVQEPEAVSGEAVIVGGIALRREGGRGRGRGRSCRRIGCCLRPKFVSLYVHHIPALACMFLTSKHEHAVDIAVGASVHELG
jgi:hypothetical protein